ncbi:hypothetical protein [Inquilinus limosus]|uniref:hypothetical protein n=1 Tax=Inquilinus limosus TaxID=171674 RepID=UPI000429DD43|nr:hypothetical protein [Inquilinus limosus]
MTSRIRIRAARPEDRDALGALKLRASLAWGEHVEELQALPEARQVPAEHLPSAVVAELDGRVVGFATVLPRDDGGPSWRTCSSTPPPGAGA